MPRRGIDLTEDQWSTVKAHAARRRQTISQFFQDVLGDLGMDGRPRSAVTTRMKPDETLPMPEGRVVAEVTVDGVRSTFGASKPAPKPGKAKR